MDRLVFMSSALHKEVQNLDMNRGRQSDTMLSESPCLVNMCLRNGWANSRAVSVVWQGRKMPCLVSLHMTTRMVSYPSDSRSLTMWSKEIKEVMVLAEDVELELGMVWNVDTTAPEEEFFVGGQGEGSVMPSLIAGGPGVMIMEILVPGGLVDLAQHPFVGQEQYSIQVLWRYHEVEHVPFCLEQLLGVDIKSSHESVRFGSELPRALLDHEVILGEGL